eukprot:6188662-Pleurochrysis_carterae.AAC.2
MIRVLRLLCRRDAGADSRARDAEGAPFRRGRGPPQTGVLTSPRMWLSLAGSTQSGHSPDLTTAVMPNQMTRSSRLRQQ